MGREQTPAYKKSSAIERFDVSTREILLDGGFSIFALRGESMSELLQIGKTITAVAPNIEQVHAMKSEVAINVKAEKNKIFSEHEFDPRVALLPNELDSDAVSFVQGNIADYTALAVNHLPYGEMFYGDHPLETKTITVPSREIETVERFLLDPVIYPGSGTMEKQMINSRVATIIFQKNGLLINDIPEGSSTHYPLLVPRKKK